MSADNMDKRKIIIENGVQNYIAYIEGHSEIWGFGGSRYEAVGDLIISHQDYFNVDIDNR